MGQIALPSAAAPGPTKPEVRAVLLEKLSLGPSDHFVDVGAGTGAVSIAAARIADRVTAIERDVGRVEAVRENFRANDVDSTVEVRHGEAPERLPDDADAVFIGGTRNMEAVLDQIRPMGAERVVLNAARMQTATRAIDAFEARDLLTEVLSLQIGRGYDLEGETGLRADNPVFVIVGSTSEEANGGPGEEAEESAGKDARDEAGNNGGNHLGKDVGDEAGNNGENDAGDDEDGESGGRST